MVTRDENIGSKVRRWCFSPMSTPFPSLESLAAALAPYDDTVKTNHSWARKHKCVVCNKYLCMLKCADNVDCATPYVYEDGQLRHIKCECGKDCVYIRGLCYLCYLKTHAYPKYARRVLKADNQPNFVIESGLQHIWGEWVTYRVTVVYETDPCRHIWNGLLAFDMMTHSIYLRQSSTCDDESLEHHVCDAKSFDALNKFYCIIVSELVLGDEVKLEDLKYFKIIYD